MVVGTDQRKLAATLRYEHVGRTESFQPRSQRTRWNLEANLFRKAQDEITGAGANLGLKNRCPARSIQVLSGIDVFGETKSLLVIHRAECWRSR